MIVVNLQDALHTMAHGQELLEHISELSAIIGRKYDHIDLNTDEVEGEPDITIYWMYNEKQDAVALQHTEDEPTIIVVEKVPDYPAGALARSVSPELFLAQLRGLGWAEIQFDLAG